MTGVQTCALPICFPVTIHKVENLQVLKSLAGYYDESGAWTNHPAVKMWRGHEDWLFLYNEAIIEGIVLRGFKNTTHIQFDEIYEENFLELESDKPWWLGDEKVHYSHKGRLFLLIYPML